MLFIAALLLMLAVSTIYTRSFFIAGSTFLCFILLLPLTTVLMAYLFGVKYLTNALGFALFVGLPPIMFDLFVAFDVWEDSGRFWFFFEINDTLSLYCESLAKRLSYTFKVAGRIIFISNFVQFAFYLAIASAFNIAVPY